MRLLALAAAFNILVFNLLLAPIVCAQPKSEIPLYGTEPKTDAEKKTDQEFIAQVTQSAGGKENAAKYFLDQGWKAIESNNPVEAIKRFNQAYLLSPYNYQVFWGLGAALGQKADFAQSNKLFEQAIGLNAKDADLLCDYGFSFMQAGLMAAHTAQNFETPEVKQAFAKATEQLEQAIALDPTNALPYSRLAVLSFYQGDFAKAQENVTKSQALGGKGLDPKFIEALKKQSPKPAQKETK